MKNFFSNLFGFGSTPWWVRITTAEPNCIYYFGPFDSEADATRARPGYIEDLQNEGAQQIETSLKNIQAPTELTVEVSSKLPSSMMMTA